MVVAGSDRTDPSDQTRKNYPSTGNSSGFQAGWPHSSAISEKAAISASVKNSRRHPSKATLWSGGFCAPGEPPTEAESAQFLGTVVCAQTAGKEPVTITDMNQVISPAAEPQLEYLITQLIYKVTRSRKVRIGVMSSLPVMGTPARPYQGVGEKPGWAPVEELKKQYDVTEVPVSAPEIPSGLAALIVIHPRRLSDETFFALDQFVLRGGHLLAFVDPLCLAQRDSGPEQSTFGLMKDSSS